VLAPGVAGAITLVLALGAAIAYAAAFAPPTLRRLRSVEKAVP